MVCSDLGNSYSKFLNFKITPNGENPSTAISIFYISLLIILVILFILTTIILFFHENFAWHIGLFSIDYILMLGISLIGWQMADNFLTSIPFISTILHIVWLLLMIGFFPFIIIISFELFLKMLEQKEVDRYMKRGYDETSARNKARKSR